MLDAFWAYCFLISSYAHVTRVHVEDYVINISCYGNAFFVLGLMLFDYLILSQTPFIICRCFPSWRMMAFSTLNLM